MKKITGILIMLLLFCITGSAITYTVNNNNDSGVGSLRQALINANSSSGADTINFDVSVTGTITLSSSKLEINDDVVINGPGADILAIDGGNDITDTTLTIINYFPVFYLGSGTSTIQNLTIQKAGVAGIFIATGATAFLKNCTFKFNYDAYYSGGGVMISGTCSMSSCIVLKNKAQYAAGGIGIVDGTLKMDSCVVSDNQVDGGVGGIYAYNSVVSMNNCVITGNGISASYGSALKNEGSNVKLNNCTFYNNGYNLYYSGSIYNNSGALEMVNCTMADNNAYANSDNAALLYITDGNVSLINCSMAFSGGAKGAWHSITQFGGTLFLLNTILMGNKNVTDSSAYYGSDGFVSSGGHNICSDTSMQFVLTAPGDTNNANPMLDTLANNNGPTPTCALQAGSPAINAGTYTGAPAYDQRGYGRNGAVDIGSYEYQGDSANIVIPDSITLVYQLDNGGLYGGSSADLTYSRTTNRLFSGIETPASLFISDDDAVTWYQAFDNDSLEFGNKSRGWSGKASRILTNSNGWVAVKTNHPKIRYSSVAISYANGDTNTWQTVVDPVRLIEWNYTSHHVSAIALSDYYLMAALGPFIVKKGSGKINPLTDIYNIFSLGSGLLSSSTVNSIALANNSFALPFYIGIDENGYVNGFNRRLYKYNGITFTELTLPASLDGIHEVFTHPADTNGDTLFISGIDINTSEYKIYRSFDSGANWTDISYSLSTNFLTDVDYSTNWNLTASNNAILIISGNAISKDLGASWEAMSDTNYKANAVKPTDINTVAGSDKAVSISTSGVGGSFIKTPNDGLAALEVNKIANTKNKTIFYIATKTGLAYTTAYLDTTVKTNQKWKSPYGEFPLISDTINFGAVAIDPTDSSHVIAGSPYGFYTTFTGPNGFSAIVPTNFSTNDPQVNDIKILNKNIAIAVTGGDSATDAGKGKIWRTTDGGLTWSDSNSPFDFSSGNTIAVGYATDTVIYVGSGLMDADKGYLWESTDMGNTWNKMNNGPVSMSGTFIQGLPINDIEVDPRGTDTLYIAAGYDNEYAFILSLDGGNSYIYLNNSTGEPYTSIAINNEYPDTVYAASGREIYLYDFANNGFRFMFRSLPDEKIYDLMIGSVNAGTSTGFYTYHPTWEDDLDSTLLDYAFNSVNGYDFEVFPNPFTNQTTIRLYASEPGNLSIDLYDLTGRRIESFYNGNCRSGYNNYHITANKLASGTYLVYVTYDKWSGRKLLYHIR